MTIREYILQKLQAFGAISEAELLDMSMSRGFELADEYDNESAEEVAKAIIELIEGKILAPTMKSVSEGGFSASWDYSNVGKYYIWLCRKHDIKPNPDVTSMLNVNMLTDKSDIW